MRIMVTLDYMYAVPPSRLFPHNLLLTFVVAIVLVVFHLQHPATQAEHAKD